jgi:hypothetical protein
MFSSEPTKPPQPLTQSKSFNAKTSQYTPTVLSTETKPEHTPKTKEDILNEIANGEHKVILDIFLMRQRAQEKAKLKSDEELGVQMNIPTSVIKKKLAQTGRQTPTIPLETRSKKQADSEPEFPSSNSTEKLSDSAEKVVKNKAAEVCVAAPLAKSETFENLDDESQVERKQAKKNLITKRNEDKFLDERYLSFEKNPPIVTNMNKKRLIKPCIQLSTSSSESESNASSDDLGRSFNALNLRQEVMNGGGKRTEQEERNLERQSRTKRLRVAQEIQRNLAEIENKMEELTRDGASLERAISRFGEAKYPEQIHHKERMEQELYRLIHEKNLLTRAENDLHIK